MHDDGTYVGRSAPEIDMFEAQVSLYKTTFLSGSRAEDYRLDHRRPWLRVSIRTVWREFLNRSDYIFHGLGTDGDLIHLAVQL